MPLSFLSTDPYMRRVYQFLAKLQERTVHISFLLWLVRVCSYCILAIPLLVDQAAIWPAVFPKVIYFNVLVEIAATAWFLLMALDKRYRPNMLHPTIAAFTLLIGALVVTSLTSQDAQRSFFSTTQWGVGTFTYLHCWLWFLILVTTTKAWREWRYFFLTSI